MECFNQVSLTVFYQGEVVTFAFDFNQGFLKVFFIGKVITFGSCFEFA